MTNILKIVLTSAFLILPVISFSNASEIKDEYFTGYDTRCVALGLIPHRNGVDMEVEAKRWNESKIGRFKPDYKVYWQHNDSSFESQEFIDASIKCGEKTLKASHLCKPVPYRFVSKKNYFYKQGENDVYYSVKTYERGDGSLISIQGEPKYEVFTKSEIVEGNEISICVGEKEEFSQWEYKDRHSLDYYTASDIYLITMKRVLSKRKGNYGQTTVVSRKLVKREYKFLYNEPDSAECGSDGYELPE